jgi:hypothetical protein
MKRREFLAGMTVSLAGLTQRGWGAIVLQAGGGQNASGLLVVHSAQADASMAQHARELAQATSSHPLLSQLASSGVPAVQRSSEDLQPVAQHVAQRAASASEWMALATNHVILVGLTDDPLIAMAWRREARSEPGGLHVFGFGHLRGDIGYVESGRNPFLHAAAVPQAPMETQLTILTGSSVAGVQLAVRALLDRHLLNGVVAARGWQRGPGTLLDQNPLAPEFTTPPAAPAQLAGMSRVGWTQASRDEYMGVLTDTGTEPVEIWRAKYLNPAAWEGAGSIHALDAYMAGLDRRAYGNTLWMANFGSAQKAMAAMPRIGQAAGMRQTGDGWQGSQPPYASGNGRGERPHPGSLSLSQNGEWLWMQAIQQM